MNDTPMVTKISVNEKTDTITVKAKNANRIVWVSNGNVIKRQEISGGEKGISTYKIDLHDKNLKSEAKLFLRFYVTGPQGICYSQPFTLHETDSKGRKVEFESVDVPKTHDISTFLRGFVTVVDWIFFRFNPLIWVFKYFALGYNPLERLF